MLIIVAIVFLNPCLQIRLHLERRPIESTGSSFDWIAWARNCRFSSGSFAEFFGVEAFELDGFFLFVTHRPAAEWLAEVQVWDAALLVGANWHDDEIAKTVGFESLSHFHSAFGAYHGVSPEQFRTLLSERAADWWRNGQPAAPWDRAFEALKPRARVHSAIKAEFKPSRILLIEVLEFQSRLSQINVVQTEETLARILFEALKTRLLRAFPRVEPDTILESANWIVAEHFRFRNRYDPHFGLLEPYLFRKAWSYVANRLRNDHRRTNRDKKIVDLLCLISPKAGNLSTDEEICEEASCAKAKVTALKAFFSKLSASDRLVLKLKMRGVRETGVFARHLGLEALSQSDQRRTVNRIKDRLKKMAIRFFQNADQATKEFLR